MVKRQNQTKRKSLKSNSVKRNSLKRRKHKHYAKYFLGVAVVLSLIFVVMLIIEFVNFSFIGKVFEEPHLIELGDECSLIMGNLVHQVRDETDCNLRCNNACSIEGTNLKKINFTESYSGCHSCDCYCK